MLALFQFLALELNSRANTTGGPAVLCFMAHSSFAALICEVNWLLCGVALCFTIFLVPESLACSQHLHRSQIKISQITSQYSVRYRNVQRGMHFATVEHGCLLKSTTMASFDHPIVYRCHESFPVLLVCYVKHIAHVFWTFFSKQNQQTWVKISYNKKEFIHTKKKSAFIKGTLRSLETSKMNLRGREWLTCINRGENFIPSWRGNSTGRISLKHLFITEQSSLWGSVKWIKISFLSLNILN